MKRTDFKSIFYLFIKWRLFLFAISFIAFLIIKFNPSYPYSETVLEITSLPRWIWTWGGFDGVHYLRLAQNGYGDAYTQAFFPLFPIFIALVSFVFPRVSGLDLRIFVDPSYFYSGIVLSNIFVLSLLYGFHKLLLLDHKQKDTFFYLVLVLIFPTAFYLGAIYTESLFLSLAVFSFYFARKRKFLLAGLLALLASATRPLGIFLVIPLFLEMYTSGVFKKFTKNTLTSSSALLIAPLGIITYMYYLWRNFGDPLLFLNAQPGFGAERSASIILLPQVFYRYFKILTSVPVNSYQFFTAGLELWFTLFLIYILIYTFKSSRKSYWYFVLFTTLAPTLTGTFSSMPRYVLPLILLLPYLKLAGLRKRVYVTISFSLLIILTVLFTSGLWVA